MSQESFGAFLLATIDETPILTLKGEIDISNVRDFEEALRAVSSAEKLIIDMSAVNFLDSTALAALVRHRNGAAARGCTITLVISNPLVQRIFDITNFDSHFAIVRRLEDARSR
jgi:anti-sigma B factor antagonist